METRPDCSRGRLEGDEAVEDEERDLVLEHDHVALDGVHEAAGGEDGVVAGVAEGLEAVGGGGAGEELEDEGAVEDRALDEVVAGDRAEGGVVLVAGAGAVLELPVGV